MNTLIDTEIGENNLGDWHKIYRQHTKKSEPRQVRV